MVPDCDEFIEVLVRCFNAGLDSIQVFERWSKHNELTPYSEALEEWDDKVGDLWEEPESLVLNPTTWINENPLFNE